VSGYKALVYRIVDTAFQQFTNSVKKDQAENGQDTDMAAAGTNSFQVTPLNFYLDNNIVSIRYLFSSNTSGAAHAVNGLRSINYDIASAEAFTVNDYFSFATRNDSDLIVNILDEQFKYLRDEMTDTDPWTFYNINKLDFNIAKDSITFNFPDYALGQGPTMLDYKVSKTRLVNLIHQRYR